MRTGVWVAIMVALAIIIVILAYMVFVVPAPGTATGTATGATTTQNGTATSAQPLSARVIVTSPKAQTAVGKTFVVSGQAPGPWFFEASFPIKVIDKDGNVLVNTHATAQGDWMTTEQVTFTANIAIANYSGSATLVLLKDNPSGLPEHDDSVEIPIEIQ